MVILMPFRCAFPQKYLRNRDVVCKPSETKLDCDVEETCTMIILLGHGDVEDQTQPENFPGVLTKKVL